MSKPNIAIYRQAQAQPKKAAWTQTEPRNNAPKESRRKAAGKPGRPKRTDDEQRRCAGNAERPAKGAKRGRRQKLKTGQLKAGLS